MDASRIAESGTALDSSEAPMRPDKGRLLSSLNHVYFEAVCRHGSIRRAANTLHIASSALNRRILDLEEEVGSPLFERLPRGVRLTAPGELFLAYVQRTAKELQRLELQLQQLRGQARGTVRIAVAESVTPSLLPNAIGRYREQHAGIAFHVIVDGPYTLNEALLHDRVDLVLTHERPDQAGIELLAAASHPVCVLVAPDHPLAQRDSVSLSECAAYPWALPDRSLAIRTLLDAAFERLSLTLAPAIESNSIETLKSYARQGQALCFSFHLGSEAEAHGLVPVRLDDRSCTSARLYLATRKGRVLPVAAASFAEVVKDALRNNVTLLARA